MKKNGHASDLAARIAAAAKQPAGTRSLPSSSEEVVELTNPRIAVEPTKIKKTKPREHQTIPITLRPDSALWNRFVLKASERTRQEGRVVSAQQIMLETLERSDA